MRHCVWRTTVCMSVPMCVYVYACVHVRTNTHTHTHMSTYNPPMPSLPPITPCHPTGHEQIAVAPTEPHSYVSHLPMLLFSKAPKVPAGQGAHSSELAVHVGFDPAGAVSLAVKSYLCWWRMCEIVCDWYIVYTAHVSSCYVSQKIVVGWIIPAHKNMLCHNHL